MLINGDLQATARHFGVFKMEPRTERRRIGGYKNLRLCPNMHLCDLFIVSRLMRMAVPFIADHRLQMAALTSSENAGDSHT